MKRFAITLAASLVALTVLAATAAAAPIWHIDLHHNETNFPPGGTAQYWVELNNLGDTASSGPITVTVKLPKGITRDAALTNAFDGPLNLQWKCPGVAGESAFVCTTTGVVPAHALSRNLIISVDIAGDASGVRSASAKVEGGGAGTASTVEPTQISPDRPGFGIVAASFLPDFFKADGATPEREAGAHPDRLVFPFDFNSIPTEALDPNVPLRVEDESVRNLTVDLPPGFVGNPSAVGECTQAEFTIGTCPRSSQVGRIDLTVRTYLELSPYYNISVPVFNLSHPRGVVTDLAFYVQGNPVHIKASLDAANHYAITTTVSDINETLPPFNQRLTLWGVPADPSHDAERCGTLAPGLSCSTDATPRPFLSLPSQCEADNVMRLRRYDSWQNPGIFGSEIDYTLPGKMTDCDKPRFEPAVEIHPTGSQANTPTGLDVHIKVPQNENPNALATPPVKSTSVTLPEGMSFSPSFADGLQSCTLAQMKLGTNEPISCPDASRIGEVELSSPLLPKPTEGSMYLAAQGDNPYGSLFALYLVLHDTEERGVLLKIPGRIDVDETTGQITTTFDETPQLPFDDLTLKFRSGPRAPLVNPPACGTHTIGVKISSYAQPGKQLDLANTYQVSEGPNGTPCPPSSASRPFAPSLSGGTLNPSAGTYSPFVFRLSRQDSEQELSQVTTILPPGLTAKLAGIPACPDEAIASISTAEGAGAQERDRSACPAASQVGTISAGLGAGPGPNYFPGKVYLAGPYKGAPLSLAIVAPGLAGPFDLGNVVVRAAIKVNPSTAQVTAVSDPFPTILHGVILRVRDVRLRVDRSEMTLNPTSCRPMSVGGLITGVGGDLLSTADDSLFSAADRFQVGNCSALAFKPKLALRLIGGTRRGAHPKLRATLRMPAGGANIRFASVALPHSEFLDQAHIQTICTRVQFAAEACPAKAVYGTAVAKTPLFSSPLKGPVYLRSSDNPLPDMVAVLRGPSSQPIQIELAGRIDSVNGGIRNTFDVVPDAPVETFTLELQGGKKGLLVNSRNLCKSVNRATVKFVGQNGKVARLRPLLQNSCKNKAS